MLGGGEAVPNNDGWEIARQGATRSRRKSRMAPRVQQKGYASGMLYHFQNVAQAAAAAAAAAARRKGTHHQPQGLPPGFGSTILKKYGPRNYHHFSTIIDKSRRVFNK
jgi:hypothetical protein